MLNLFFASEWGQQYGYSFNAPVWSVSIEILLYVIFFISTFAFGKSVVVCVIMMTAGYWMAVHGLGHFGWGLFCFFAGGIAFLIYEHWRYKPGVRRDISPEYGSHCSLRLAH